MTLAAPAGLWILAAIPIIAALHFLVRTRHRVVVPSMVVWRRMVSVKRRRMRLRALINRHLVLQSVALLFIALALSDPRPMGGESTEAMHLVAVVDTTAGMGALEPTGLRRIEGARSALLSDRRAAPRGSRMTVITFGAHPRVRGHFDIDDPALEDLISRLAATDEGGEPAGALRLAVESAAESDGRAITTLYTDGTREIPPWFGARTEERIHLVSTAVPNAGITTLSIRRDTDGIPVALIGVLNASTSTFRGTIALETDVVEAISYPVAVDSDGHTRLVVELPAVAGTWLRATLYPDETAQDALEADNHAWFVFGERPRFRVALVGTPDRFVEAALTAHPRLIVERHERYDPALSADFAVFIDHSEEVPSRGRVISIASTIAGVPETHRHADAADDTLVWNPDHRLTTALSGSSVYLARSRRYTPGPDGAVLLGDAEGAAAFTMETPTVRLLGIGFHPADSSVAAGEDFPLLIYNAIEWLIPDSTLGGAVAAGTTIRAVTPPGGSLIVTRPDGRRGEATRSELETVITDTAHAGIYELASPTRTEFVAVNLTDRHETDLRPRISETVVTETERMRAAGPPLWTVAALLAAALLLADAWSWSRRDP